MSQPTYSFSGGINTGVAGEMTDAQVRIKGELDQLDTDLKSSLSSWETPTSKAQYQAAKTRWDNAALTMPQSLQIASSTLEQITTRMRNTESAVTESWS